MKLKRIFITVGAGLAAASILAACGSGGNKKENATEETNSLEASDKKSDESLQPVTAASEETQTTSSTETTESAEAVASVYGDGVDPATAESSENGLDFLREQLAGTAGTMCGFAYLGSAKDGASLEDLIKNSDTAKNYSFIKDMDVKKIISDGGDDIFVFVPTDADSKVQINTFAESDNGKTIYSSEKGVPFLIRTMDELNDSMEIVITDSVGNVGHFTPDITTGSIADVIYKDVTGYNFTTDAVISSDVNRKYMLDALLMREPSLNELMANGVKLSKDSYRRIYIDDLEFYTLDFGHEDSNGHVTERLYAVSKDGTLIYRYSPEAEDWMDLIAFDYNAEQYR